MFTVTSCILEMITAQKWYVAFSTVICILTGELDNEPVEELHSYLKYGECCLSEGPV